MGGKVRKEVSLVHKTTWVVGRRGGRGTSRGSWEQKVRRHKNVYRKVDGLYGRIWGWCGRKDGSLNIRRKIGSEFQVETLRRGLG